LADFSVLTSQVWLIAPLVVAWIGADPVIGIHTQISTPGGGAAQIGFASAANAILSQASLSYLFE
jgi:hypothetical protein